MINPYPQIPLDKGNTPLQEFAAPFIARKQYTNENGTASSVISVTHDTTMIEVAAVGGPAALKWIPTTDTTASVITIAGATANYDHVISSGTIRRFAIPLERAGASPASVQGANRANGLYQRVAIKSMGVSSVLLSEF